jgi:hypothetical protein
VVGARLGIFGGFDGLAGSIVEYVKLKHCFKANRTKNVTTILKKDRYALATYSTTRCDLSLSTVITEETLINQLIYK